MSRIFSDPRPQFKKENGVDVNTNGKLYFREPGSGSTTLKTVFSNSALSTPLTNPVILDANGLAPSIFLDGDYNVEEADSADVQIWRVDNYDPPELQGQYSDWSSIITYAINDIVRGSDGNYYQSLASGNITNDPTTSPANWVKIFLISEWSTLRAYAIDEYAQRSGELYRALLANTGNDPLTSRTNWDAVTVSKFDDWISAYTYEADDIVRGSDGLYYISLDGGTGIDPISSSLWAQIIFIEEYLNSKTYNENEVVQSSGLLYRSRVSSNQGNTPVSSPTEWSSLTNALTGQRQPTSVISTVGTTLQDLVVFNIDGVSRFELFINVLVNRSAGAGGIRFSPIWGGTNGSFVFGDGYLNDANTPTANDDYVFTTGGISPTLTLQPTSSLSTVTWRTLVTSVSGTTSLTIRATSDDGSTNLDFSAGGAGYAKLEII